MSTTRLSAVDRMALSAKAQAEHYKVRTNKRHAWTVAIITAIIAMTLPALVSAQGVDLGMNYAASFGLPSMDVRDAAGRIIRSLLSFLGMVLVVMILWSGFQWMVAGGDEEKTAAAKGSLKNAVIGFLLIMMSVSLTKFIVNAIADASGGSTYL